MKVINRKRFVFSCIFFILLMSFIGKVFISKEYVIKSLVTDKTVEKSKEVTTNNKHVIIIDAGHGGEDKGASYNNIFEKDLTLKIAKNVASYLQSQGNQVILTRREDELIKLKEIGNIVNESKAEVFISIHINFYKDTKLKGVTAYFYDVDDKSKNNRVVLGKDILTEIANKDGWTSRGIRKQNLAVLRYSEIPCVLVECGYLSNSEDRERLLNEDISHRLSTSIGKGIIKYFEHANKNIDIKEEIISEEPIVRE